MICPECGEKNRNGARFCRSCGRPIDQPNQKVPAQADVAAVEVPQAPAEPPEEEPRAEPGPEPGEGDVSVEEPVTEAEPELAREPEPATVDETAVEATEPGVAVPEAPPEAGPPDEVEVVPESEAGPEADQPAPAAPGELAAGEAAEAGVEAASGDEEELEADQDDLSTFWREDKEPIEPVASGTLVDARYLVLEVLDVGEDAVLYRARDLLRCWQCGAEIEADEAFCPQCGAAQQQASPGGSEARLLEVRPPGETAPPETNVLARLTHEGRPFFVIAEPQAEPQAPSAPPAPESIRLIVGQRSHPGQVRELDEDSILAMQIAPTYQAVTSPVLALFAVADGMGGHEGGEIASKIALQVLADHTLRTIVLPELKGELLLDDEALARLRRAVLEANDAVYLARQKRANDMGTTLTTVLIRDRRMLLAHVGDCRAYRWSGAGLEQLTTDHSVVASMIAHGQVAPEEIYTHPHRSVIYRAVGDQPMVEVDGDLLPLEPGDRIVICSDGLWEMVRTEGIADVMMQEANPQVACDLLVRLANAAGGEDNISLIVVQVEAA